MMTKLEQEIEQAINRHSAENYSNTPDFILAQYLMACLAAFNAAVQRREKWWGHVPPMIATLQPPGDTGTPLPQNPVITSASS
jgi:hypothetical protein